jgi:hypothetical protein
VSIAGLKRVEPQFFEQSILSRDSTLGCICGNQQRLSYNLSIGLIGGFGMFRTDISTMLGSPGRENECFHWGCVEHSLELPWFYVAVVASKNQNTTMVQVMDPIIFIELLEGHGKTIRITDVQLVTPPIINGSEMWKMERLLEFSLLHYKHGGRFECYEVDNGCYTTLQEGLERRENYLGKLLIYKRDNLKR